MKSLGRLSFARWACLVALAGTTVASGQGAPATERSGKQVVDSLCISCHGTGNAGAPKIGDRKAWAPLIDKGLTALSKTAMTGTGNMPSHGGNMKLTDIEVERAITYMVNQSGGRWTEPVSRTQPSARLERCKQALVEGLRRRHVVIHIAHEHRVAT